MYNKNIQAITDGREKPRENDTLTLVKGRAANCILLPSNFASRLP
jgi:hypothetical protein